MANFIEQTLTIIYDFIDDAYKEGWLLYVIIGLIVLFVIAMLN